MYTTHKPLWNAFPRFSPDFLDASPDFCLSGRAIFALLHRLGVNMSALPTEEVPGKAVDEKIESLEPVHTHIGDEEVAELTDAHREYLLRRHGTLLLDPIPDMSDADPYNWPQSRVRRILE